MTSTVARRKRSPSRAGQALSEYALMAGLVLIASVVAWPLLGNQLEQALWFLRPSAASPTFTAVTAPNSPNTASSSGQPSLVTSGTDGTHTLTFLTADGRTITLSNYPANTQELIETAGAAGVTQYASAALESLAQQLLNSGDVTQEQANALIALANQGYKLSAFAKEVESITSQYSNETIGSFKGSVLTSVRYAGNQLTLDQLARLMGSELLGPGASLEQYINDTPPVAGAGDEFNHFGQLYQAARAQGALNNATIQSIVNDLTLQIFNSMESSAHVIGAYWKEPASKYTSQLQANAAVGTHGNSGICSAGGGENQNWSCQ